MSRPRLLELGGCEGASTFGYQNAGWHVTSVDIDKAALSHNPADVTVLADGIDYLAEHGHRFDGVAMHWPCQRWAANGANTGRENYPDLITPSRPLVEALGVPYVYENVAKAPLRRDLILCGRFFNLTAIDTDGTLLHLDRHRVFESNVPLMPPPGAWRVPPHRCGPKPGIQWAGVYGGARTDKDEARNIRKGGYTPRDADIQSALLGGVPWMTGKGRRECVPPVYAQHIGTQLLAHLALEAAA